MNKYEYVGSVSAETFNRNVNGWAEQGYYIKFFEPVESKGTILLTAVMSLKEDGKYDDITKFKKIPITFEEQALSEGWDVIHHTSKEMIVVKREATNTTETEATNKTGSD